MRRREFIAGLGSAVAWPLAARAQRGDRVWRIGMLIGLDENDPDAKPRISAFTQALAGLGWTDGRNVRMDLRWASGDINRTRALAQALVGLQPDIILSDSTPATVALQRETRTIPIVFAGVADPVASGIVARLDRPSGNITGFDLCRSHSTRREAGGFARSAADKIRDRCEPQDRTGGRDLSATHAV
jgi:putative ABC transport system substrate-binding protein